MATRFVVSKWRRRLQGILDRVGGDRDELRRVALASDVESDEDRLATIAGQSSTLESLERDSQTRNEVLAALARYRDGTFGRCEDCDQPIGVAPLDAIPYARQCIECAR